MQKFLRAAFVIDDYFRHAVLELILRRRQDTCRWLINTVFVIWTAVCGSNISCFCFKSMGTRYEQLFSCNDQKSILPFDRKYMQFHLCSL
jgi:hypothetical protein